MADAFIQQFARLLGLSPDDTHEPLANLADSILQEVESGGESHIEGLGVFRHDGEVLTFEPTSTLARAVNHRYAGLRVLESVRETDEAPLPDEEAQDVPTPEAAAPEASPLWDASDDEPEAAAETDDAPAPDFAAHADEEQGVEDGPARFEDVFAEADDVDLDLPPNTPSPPVRDLSSEPVAEDSEIEESFADALEEGALAAAVVDTKDVDDDTSFYTPETHTEDEAPDEDELVLEGTFAVSDVEPTAAEPGDADDAHFADDTSLSAPAEITEIDAGVLSSIEEPGPPDEADEEAHEVEAGDAEPAIAESNPEDAALGGSMLDEDALATAPLNDPDEGLDADEIARREESNELEIDALLEGAWAPAMAAGVTTDDDDAPSLDSTPAESREGSAEEQPETDDEPLAEELAAEADEVPDEQSSYDNLFAASAAPPDSASTETKPEDAPEGATAEDAAPTPHPHVAPGFAATARDETPPVDREARPPRERSSRMPVFLVLAGVALVAIALFWFFGRPSDAPVVAEQPIAADTSATITTTDSAATAAVGTPDDPAVTAPDLAETPATADPLRGAEGIDRADGGFSWITGSEFSRGPADRRVTAYREQGFRSDVIVEETGGRTRYRVAIGQFDSIEEAERLRSELPADVPSDTWLLRL